MLAAGSSLEPFWDIYRFHYSDAVYEMLEECRIGNLDKSASVSSVQQKPTDPSRDPFENEPKRHPLLRVLTTRPFNAETPKALSAESLVTPNELHFIRNHLPVPLVDTSTYLLEIKNEITGETYSFNLDEIKNKFSNYTIPVTIQCSGNRRRFMHELEAVQGLMWDVNAISTSEWTGIRLKDLLKACKVNFDDPNIQHIQFEGYLKRCLFS
jgi:sulfite oxidase